ncbi:MAG: hypothetical protein AB7I27_01510 [Bacteriovoracaceae bacterium]
MHEWIKDLRYVLMSSRHPAKGYEEEYHAAYKTWRSAWEKFRAEIGVKDPLSSDGFIIPDEMGVLFYKNECVGFASFTHGNLAKGPIPDHSWFKAWTSDAYEKLKNISADAIICSQFTVDPKFTGRNQVVRWKEIVFLFNHLRFLNSDAGVMAGHLNLTRGMQNAGGEEWGATVLDPLHPFNYSGVPLNAQLVAYQRETVLAMIQRKEFGPLCEQLWSKLEHVSDFSVTNNIIPIKKAA